MSGSVTVDWFHPGRGRQVEPEQALEAEGLLRVERLEAGGQRGGTAAALGPPPSHTPHASTFGEWLPLRAVASEPGPGLPLIHAEVLSRALRGALLRHATDPAPAVLTGHAEDGAPLDQPHIACVPLPDLDAPGRPTASIAGAAIVFPRRIAAEDLQASLLAAGRWENSGLRLWLGRLGAFHFERAEGPALTGALAADGWTRPSHRWATVTPIALDRNPGEIFSEDASRAARATLVAEETIARACERIGLPRPAQVRVLRRSRIDGMPPASQFMPFPRAGSRLKRICVHAELRFPECIAGPVLIGAGRYYGVGLCRPL